MVLLLDQETVPSSPSRGSMTLEDLDTFVRETWKNEMHELSAGLRRDVCQELRRCFADTVGVPMTPMDYVTNSFLQPAECWMPRNSDFASPPVAPVKAAPVPKPQGWVEEPSVAPPMLLPNMPVHREAYGHSRDSAGCRPRKGPATGKQYLKELGTPRSVRNDPLRKLGQASRPSLKRQASMMGPAMVRRKVSMETSSSVATPVPSPSPSPSQRKSWSTRKRTRKHGRTRFHLAMQAELRNLSETQVIRQSRLSFLLRLVTSHKFDLFVFMLLMANAILIGAQVDYLAGDPDRELTDTYRALNIGFCSVFFLELAVRIIAWGRRFFAMDDYLWNMFDCFVVTFTVLDEVATTMLKDSHTGEVIDNMGVLRLLRMGRLGRIVRMVRIIPTLKSMVYLTMASMPSFVWTLVLMLMLMYCIAVYFTEVATDLMRSDLGAPTLPETWGSVAASIMSLWCAITGGDDWRNLTNAFGHNQFYPVNLMFFSLYISFAMLVMLNLVTGVFVDGMQRIIRDDKERELVKTAVEVFAEADIDQNQDLSEEEFQDILGVEALVDYFQHLGIHAEEASQLFNVLDTDSSGTLTLTEFVYGCVRLAANTRVVDIALMEQNMKNVLDGMQAQVGVLVEQVNAVYDTLHCRPPPSRRHSGSSTPPSEEAASVIDDLEWKEPENSNCYYERTSVYSGHSHLRTSTRSIVRTSRRSGVVVPVEEC